MKINRYKKANKHLNFYVVNYGFHKPFQLLIDGTFCFASTENRVQIREEIPKYLGGDVKLLTTQCVILETERLGHSVRSAMFIVKSFGIHKCGHNKNPVTGSQCLLSMVLNNNPNRYIIATQDKDLQREVLNIPGTPLLYFNRTSAVLKSPSEISVKVANQIKANSVKLNEHQEKMLVSLKYQTFGKEAFKKTEELDESPFPKKCKGPNPLSCKKKKKMDATFANNCENNVQTDKIHKRNRRKRIKVPTHVKEELFLRKSATSVNITSE